MEELMDYAKRKEHHNVIANGLASSLSQALTTRRVTISSKHQTGQQSFSGIISFPSWPPHHPSCLCIIAMGVWKSRKT